MNMFLEPPDDAEIPLGADLGEVSGTEPPDRVADMCESGPAELSRRRTRAAQGRQVGRVCASGAMWSLGALFTW
jgi:hypothetical protein